MTTPRTTGQPSCLPAPSEQVRVDVERRGGRFLTEHPLNRLDVCSRCSGLAAVRRNSCDVCPASPIDRAALSKTRWRTLVRRTPPPDLVKISSCPGHPEHGLAVLLLLAA
jgi:hypothetical protein